VSEPAFVLEWFGPLGASVALFLFSGCIHLLIGLLAPIFIDRDVGRQMLVMSRRTDAAYFGEDPPKLLAKNPELARFRSLFTTSGCGSLVVIGLFIVMTAWFGLRTGQAWSLVALSAAAVAILPYWYLTFRPYLEAGVRFRLGDLPPIFWIPAAVSLPAIVLGVIGLRGSG
jgi:hypothetical protein